MTSTAHQLCANVLSIVRQKILEIGAPLPPRPLSEDFVTKMLQYNESVKRLARCSRIIESVVMVLPSLHEWLRYHLTPYVGSRVALADMLRKTETSVSMGLDPAILIMTMRCLGYDLRLFEGRELSFFDCKLY